jgi:hypothetical protein
MSERALAANLFSLEQNGKKVFALEIIIGYPVIKEHLQVLSGNAFDILIRANL